VKEELWDNSDKKSFPAHARTELKRKLEELAVPMEKHTLTQGNFEKLFPNGSVATPLGKVKLGENQFAKLKARDREDLLVATFQTLSDPVAVLSSDKGGRKARMYVKSFKKEAGISAVVSVVVNQFDGTKPIKVSISTHRKDVGNVLSKIKSPDDIVYLKANTKGAAPPRNKP